VSVFDEGPREDASPSRQGESTADFYNRVKGPYWDDIRAVIEDWVGHLDAETRADVRARLRSSDEYNFRSALLELFLHESLFRSGYSVTCHPEVPQGTRRPDFLVSKDDKSFYLEARAVGGSGGDAGASRRAGDLYDAVNKMESADFFIWVDVQRIGANSLGARPLRRELTQWLAGLDPDDVAALSGSNVLDALPTYTLNRDGWKIVFRPIPKAADKRGHKPGSRVLGMFGGVNAQFSDDASPLRNALSDKGKAYGSLDLPYVIALGISVISDDDDVWDALYGSEQHQIITDPSGAVTTRPMRAPDGYWYRGDHWAHRGVSGVLIVRNLHPAQVASQVPVLWLHPEPQHPMEEVPIWRCMVPDAGRVRDVDNSIDPRGLFALPEPWPRGEAFPR
jgi:hypothetical protein